MIQTEEILRETFKSEWKGTLSYREGLILQERALDMVAKDPSSGFLLGLEHSPVMTAGKRIQDYAQASDLKKLLPEYELEFTDRGGQLTLHMPGQLVIYPILDLKTQRLSVREYVDLLIQVTQNTLKQFAIETREKQTSSLYTPKGKIAFFGLRIRRGLASHGLAINVSNDTQAFKKIPSCGVTDDSFDKVSNYAPELQTKELYMAWHQEFLDQLEAL